MWKKGTLAVVLVTFVGVQFANALSCYSCNSPQSCLNPSQETCSDFTANKTNTWLNSIHGDVPAVGHSDRFKCMNLTYAINTNARTHEYLGCYHPAIDVCGLNLNISYSHKNRKCFTCDWDLCNRSPAGTFSKSTYTILGSVVALILAAKSNLIM